MEQPYLEQSHSSIGKSKGLAFFLLVSIGGLAGCADSAWAFQSHPAPEGLYAHQLAHLFFALSMGVLAYWLHRNRLADQIGWRLIQICCVLFILWNVLTMAGHWVEEQISDNMLRGGPGWTQRILIGSSPWAVYYFVLKLDHLVCIPAILCLVLGLRSLHKRVLAEEDRPRE